MGTAPNLIRNRHERLRYLTEHAKKLQDKGKNWEFIESDCRSTCVGNWGLTYRTTDDYLRVIKERLN